MKKTRKKSAYAEYSLPLSLDDIRKIEDSMNPHFILANHIDLCWQARVALMFKDELEKKNVI